MVDDEIPRPAVLRLLPGGRQDGPSPLERRWRRLVLAAPRPFFPGSDHLDIRRSDLSTVWSELAHDNPAWAVSSRENAVQARRIHRDCDAMQCATLVAAIIVTRNDFEYFRDREPTRECRRRR
ncbi:hypothetical protein AB0B25_18600 [Nocardia sp. NPDC049190]|uniref:hypothetical protein n=1 Tax=Nocardia sp. NPDC049190 TaxID=3155650 RepID=UPI0033C32FC4